MNRIFGCLHPSRIVLAALLAVVAAAPLAALDSVNVTASIPVAYEAGPVNGSFTITRSGSTGTLTVSFTLGGTAIEGSRYAVVAPHSVTFADGDVSQTITISPIDDLVTQGAQFVTLTLSNDPSYIVGANSSAQVIIADNDMTLSLTVPDPIADEDAALFGDALDGMERRRGVMRATFASSTSTTAIKKALSVSVSGTATLSTDYALLYKIGSNPLTHFGSSLGDVSSGSGYQVVGAGAIGQQTFSVGSGLGGIFVDDIVQFDGDTNYYRVTASNIAAGSGSGSITVTRFITVGTSTGFPGTEVALADKANVITSFPVTSSLQNILLHDNDTKVEFSVEPVADGLAEGAESVVLTLLGNDDYALINPTVGTVTIADRDVVADVALGANAGKPTTAGYFLVTFSQAFPKAITVPYTVTGTAVAGTDYVALPGSITVPTGQTSAQIPVTPLSTPANGITTVTLTLDATLDYKLAASGSSGTNPSATLNITDAIGTVGITASTPTAVESATSPTAGVFTVSLTRNVSGGVAVPGAVTVNYSVSGAAIAGSRFTSLSGTVTVPNGSNSAQITVNPIDDLLYEGTQSVVVTLDAGQGYAINGSAAFAQVNITDDEPTISIARAADATRPSTSGSFVVSYPGVPAGSALNRAVVVPLTYTGTAIIGTDYTAPPTVTIPAGSRSATVVVSPLTSTTTSAVTVTATLGTDVSYGITTGSASLAINPVGAPTQQQSLKPDVGSVSTAKSGGCGRGSGLFAATAVLALNLVPMLRRRRR